jgi:hypothetical protein
MIQMNLANALAALGERESETARLAEATYDGALAIFVAARTDYYESICRKSRDRVRAILAVRLRNIVGTRWGMLLPGMATCLKV